MPRSAMLLPFVEMVEGKESENQYLGVYYFDSNMIRSVEPSKEGNTSIRHLDGSIVTFLIKPIDFYKLIVKFEEGINLNCIKQCAKVDSYTVNRLTEGMTLREV